MRLRTIGLAALLATSLTQQTGAVIAPKGAEKPLVSNERAPRTHRQIGWSRANASTGYAQRLAAAGLGDWHAQWDVDTDVPLRMWGKGIVAPNAVADAGAAEAAARQFLAQHLSTLAPGAKLADFQLLANSETNGIRSVSFAQYANGVRVLGGAVGFAFKFDKLVMVNSTALPNINVQVPSSQLATDTITRSASRWLGDAGHSVVARSLVPAGRLIVPIVRPRIGAKLDINYKVAEQIEMESTSGVGRWTVWVDANDATPIARRTGIHYATGRVLYNVPERSPSFGPRTPTPAPNAQVTVDGAAQMSSTDGQISWAGTTQTQIKLDLVGTFVSISNKDGNPRLTETVSISPNADFVWNHATEPALDAQLAAFIYANQAKAFVKAKINPNLAWLNGRLTVAVNENQTCNAFSTGDDIHFFKGGGGCENTGRIADVVYHEFGHSLHANSIIDGVGAFDGSLSEGLADTLAQAMTGDSGMGRGFFMNQAALRELNPTNDKVWPDDADGEPHDEGEIIGEALWDVRENLEGKLGQTAGYEQFLKVYYTVMQRAADIPSSFPEALLGDDDDGNLDNGTPNQCAIQSAFASHGLYDSTLTLGLKPPTFDNFHVELVAAAPTGNAECPPPTVSEGTIEWKLRGGQSATIPMTQSGDNFAADIPPQLDGSVLEYKVTLKMSDGKSVSFPNNAADPFYQVYVGEVQTIKCWDFEDGNVADFTKSTDWEVGAPAGLGTDPKTAFAGNNVFGTDLTRDGNYRDGNLSQAETGDIDVGGTNRIVHLQYRRWLGVEDGFYDHARILANNTEVWSNFASQSDPGAGGKNHLDKEWRFQDVDLTEQAKTGKVKLRFEIDSDEGLSFGGWTLDDVCIVALSGPGLTCGNGTVDEGETCDDGNRTDGDGCDTTCQSEDDGGGCCSSSKGAEGAALLAFGTLGLVVFRRRRK